MLPSFSWLRPATLEDAVRAAAAEGARIHAGGTDLLGCLRDGVFSAASVVSLSALRGLAGVRQGSDGALRLGALTPLATVAESDLVERHCAVLAQAAAAVGTPQLRNQGTLGGNLCQKPRCWYYRGDFHCLRKGGDTCFAEAGDNRYHCLFGGAGCNMVHPSDTAHALLALDATVRVAGPRGARSLPVAELYVAPGDDFSRDTVLEPGELIVEVVVPRPPAGTRGRYRKVRARRAWDFAVVGCALSLTLEGDRVRRARVVLAGVAPVPWRSHAAEKLLTGARLTDATLQRAADAAVEGARPLGHNAYKIPMVRGALLEELEALRG